MNQLQRIKTLTTKKATLEANILASSNRIENAYILVHHAFQYALRSRLQDLGVDHR